LRAPCEIVVTVKRVDVLFFTGCPNVEGALAHAREAVEQVGDTDIRIVHVEDDEQARRLAFLGSPTVRVDGRDVDEASVDRTDFGMQCRVYRVGERFVGAPPVEWIIAALRPRAP
jgi:hypothetical protein